MPSPNQKTVDSLASLLGGLGDPARDKLAGVFYFNRYLAPNDLLEIYRGSWLARKIVNIPAVDAVRAWRNWQADKKQIEILEAEENRLNYRQRIHQARIKARLFGGGAVYIGTGETNLLAPLDPERIAKGGVKYLTAMSSNELQVGEIDYDVTSENYGKAKFFQAGSMIPGRPIVQIHPSRVIAFYGIENPEPKFGLPGVGAYGWGDSIIQSVFDAITHADSAVANIASLLFEANVDVYGLPDLIGQLADPAYEALVNKRFALAASNKAINRMIVKDAAETYERKTISFSGLDALIDKFMQFVAGAADIPATRLFGMSPAGMSSTGESDLRNYYDMVNSGQSLEMTPAMNKGDESIIRSALGSRPAEIYYEWAPLWQMTAKERADIGKLDADTLVAIQSTALIPSEALAKVAVTQLTEHGVYPGLDQAVDELPPVDFESLDNPEPTPAPGPMPTTDASPRSLYIFRPVMNAAAIIKWARAQGFPTTIEQSALHVTIAYSKTPIDWMTVGEPWSSEIKIAAGGPRLVEQFAGGAIVLLFACSELSWRHQQVLDAGGSSDFPDYQPHITISWKGDSVDLSAIEPYQGEIILGPETFQQIDENWRAKVNET